MALYNKHLHEMRSSNYLIFNKKFIEPLPTIDILNSHSSLNKKQIKINKFLKNQSNKDSGFYFEAAGVGDARHPTQYSNISTSRHTFYQNYDNFSDEDHVTGLMHDYDEYLIDGENLEGDSKFGAGDDDWSVQENSYTDLNSLDMDLDHGFNSLTSKSKSSSGDSSTNQKNLSTSASGQVKIQPVLAKLNRSPSPKRQLQVVRRNKKVTKFLENSDLSSSEMSSEDSESYDFQEGKTRNFIAHALDKFVGVNENDSFGEFRENGNDSVRNGDGGFYFASY